MAITLKSASLLLLKKPEINFRVSFPSNKPIISVRRYTRIAAIGSESVGLSETLTKLKKQGKVSTYVPHYLGSMRFMCIFPCVTEYLVNIILSLLTV